MAWSILIGLHNQPRLRVVLGKERRHGVAILGVAIRGKMMSAAPKGTGTEMVGKTKSVLTRKNRGAQINDHCTLVDK